MTPVTPIPPARGLNTIQDLNWLGRVRLNVRRQSRAFYKSIRHPRNRDRGRMRAWMRQHIRNRGLWHPRRESVAAGLAGGLFLAMLPIPLQSFVAAGVGISRGWNLPAAISATWLSNPFTYAPMIIGAKWTISGAYGLFGADCAASHLSVQRAGEIMKEAGAFHFSLAWQMAGPAIVQIAAGMVLMGLLFATISYVMVHALWATFHRLVKN